MFCYQCEQTDRTNPVAGCQVAHGTCGKDETTSDLQDLLIHALTGIAQYDVRARTLQAGDDAAADFVLYGMFTTLTNVNFTATRFVQLIHEAAKVRDRVKARYEAAAVARGLVPEDLCGDADLQAAGDTGGQAADGEQPASGGGCGSGSCGCGKNKAKRTSAHPSFFAPVAGSPAAFVPAQDMDSLLLQAAEVGIRRGVEVDGEAVVGLRALLLYGLKGVCAYAHHAAVLGQSDPAVFLAVETALDYLATRPTDVEQLLRRSLALGKVNLRVMELLDEGNTGTFGTPEPTQVRTTPVEGKAILVSGHDLRDLHAILEQTTGTGINVYTHGELLPAHGYPVLKAYPHLAGNWGGAWQDQQVDFARFPGAIVMTSNCIIEPRPAYKARIFTTGPVGWPGVRHLGEAAGSARPVGAEDTPTDFRLAIKAAQALPGFSEADVEAFGESPEFTVGFGRGAVLGAADAVVQAVKDGEIKHFFLIGGCDGAAPGRNYYTDFATSTPSDTVVMTLGCAKFRFNDHDFGTVAGLPRLLDVGQCNDSFSAIQVAIALADAFGCEVDDLPLSLVLSWFEQKAAAVLLTLLALGIRNIKLGPTLPAFLTDDVVGVLVERFGIAPIGDAAEDLAAILGARA
ncbi:MAG: hydroxylamine reductase [Kineosporiaceae bacterium]